MARRYRTLAKLLSPHTLVCPLRGFYLVRYNGHAYAVRVGHHLVACDGEAHKNPNIDNCGLCAPNWGVRPVPLACGTLADYRATLQTARLEQAS